MSRAEAGERSSPAVTPTTPNRTRPVGRVRDAVVILLPAALVSLMLHLWAVMSPAARVNSDEALTGLQAYNVLQGHFAPMVEGNDYGGALESYLTAPLLLVAGGTLPLKTVPILLSFVAGLVLAWAALPLLGRRVALVVGAVSWVSSGAAVELWSLSYMGYASGAIAMVVTLGCAVRLMTRPTAGLAFGAGLGAGVALWGHPIFGVVAALACLPVLGVIWRRPRSFALAVIGAVLGALPWLVYLYHHGPPRVAQSDLPSTYLGRVRIILTELLPSGFGLRAPNGLWLEPATLMGVVAAVLIVGALAGLVVLAVRMRRSALPFTVAGLGAVPALAVFPALSFSADGRYAVAFIPALLVGLFGWTRVRPGWARPPLLLAAAVPVVWGVLACVPSLHLSVGWTWQDPNTSAERAVVDLQQRGITAVRGDYWTVYVLDYYAKGQLNSWPDVVQRLPDDVSRAEATPPRQVAQVYDAGAVEKGAATLPRPKEDYRLVPAGRWEIWVPAPV
jgi:hypothetical protein